jgi:hypothetical protein
MAIMTKRYVWLVAFTALLIASLACNVLTRPRGAAGSSGSAGGGTSTSGGQYNTKFPLPGSVVNFTDTGNGSINFQTKMSLKDTLQFYRDAFGKQGLKERSENSAITDRTFSLVFDGDPSGQAIVLQGVDLGNGLTNVNLRYEKV